MTTKTILLALAITLLPSSCAENRHAYDEVRTEIVSLKSEKLTFNRYTKTTEDNGGVSLKVDYNENGSIELYGNVIKINKTSNQNIFFVKSEYYDELNQVYIFKTDKSTITMDILDRSFNVCFNNEDCLETFYLQSAPTLNF